MGYIECHKRHITLSRTGISEFGSGVHRKVVDGTEVSFVNIAEGE